MSRRFWMLGAGALCLAVACSDSAPTPEQVPVVIRSFDGSPDAIEVGESTRLVFAVEPPDARIMIRELGDMTGSRETTISPTVTTTYHLVATRGDASAEATTTVTVGAQSAASIKVEPTTSQPTAGDPLTVTLTALTATGRTAVGFRGTVQLSSSDPKAELPADVAFTASDAGVLRVQVVLKTAGVNTVTAADLAGGSPAGTAPVTVHPDAARTYQLTELPATALAGQALVVTITALDEFGNIDTAYAGHARWTSPEPTDLLPIEGGFTAGVRTVSLTFHTAGTHAAIVSEVGGAIPPVETTQTAIEPAAPFRIIVVPARPLTIAGSSEAVTATLVDLFGNVCTSYQGTVHLGSSDPRAALPGDYTFTAGDAGSHTFDLTLQTAGTQSLSIRDTSRLAVTGSATWMVGPAAAASCVIRQAPAATAAGAALALSVNLEDAFGNLATTYAGTIRLAATDVRAVLPEDVTYVPLLDGGRHVFTAELLTTGAQTITATDTADASIECATLVLVRPGAPRLVVSVPGHANAGFAVAVEVAAKDVFDNPIPGYTGTVRFTSSDAGPGASTPGELTFRGDEGGVATTSATFVTLGPQTLTASDAGAPAAVGSASSTVHGLVYTAPTTGRVRLVANAAQSTPRVVQLDLVAHQRLEVSSFFGGGPGSFAAGMNLPLDTTRVGPDAVLFTPGDALPAGSGARAAVGRIGETDHVLYTVVSRKRSATPIFSQGTEVQAGQVFYSVRLQLQQHGSVGPVFDGAQPDPLVRAAVRDQFGDDFVSQSEFGIGKLEIR